MQYIFDLAFIQADEIKLEIAAACPLQCGMLHEPILIATVGYIEKGFDQRFRNDTGGSTLVTGAQRS